MNTQTETLECGIFSNYQGELLFLYRGELKHEPDYMEYNEFDNILSIIFANGESHSCDIAPHETDIDNFYAGHSVTMGKIKADDDISYIVRPFIFSEI